MKKVLMSALILGSSLVLYRAVQANVLTPSGLNVENNDDTSVLNTPCVMQYLATVQKLKDTCHNNYHGALVEECVSQAYDYGIAQYKDCRETH